MNKFLFNLIFLFLFISCSGDAIVEGDKRLNLNQLKSIDNVFEAGLKLMAMPNGLHELELIDNKQKTLVISVHGNNSRGYEWVYPLPSCQFRDKLNHIF